MQSKNMKSLPSHKALSHLCFHSPQPDTSLHCKTVDTEPKYDTWCHTCLCPHVCWYSLCLSM